MKYTINPLKFYGPRPGYDGPPLVAIEILPEGSDGIYTFVPLATWQDDTASEFLSPVGKVEELKKEPVFSRLLLS
jgi:hypothetical protein